MGQLVVSIETDMALPDQIDSFHVQIQSAGAVAYDHDYSVGPDDNHVPATLSLLAGSDPTQPVTVRVWGRKRGAIRTLREITTTVPTDRSALLRMPLQWLCDRSGEIATVDDGAGGQHTIIKSTCNDGATCVDGLCVSSVVDSASLPNYTPEAVFGGAAQAEQGSCFDTVACMIDGRVAVPDAECTIDKPAGESVNVALRVTEDGICDPSNAACFVTLDRGPEGWQPTLDGYRIKLPPAVCSKLQTGSIEAVYVSTECATKVENTPPCGAWSSVPTDRAVTPPPAAAAQNALPKLIAQLATGNHGALPCCPLMSGDNMLYTCVCSGTDKTATALAIDPSLPAPITPYAVAYVDPPADRATSSFAATVFDGDLYWNSRDTIASTPLASSQPTKRFAVAGSVYDTVSLLADASGVYTLTSGVQGMDAMGADKKGSPVRLIALHPSDGSVQVFDTGSDIAVLQFDHDAGGVYLAIDVQQASTEAGAVEHTCSVVRIDKATGERTLVLPEQHLHLPEGDDGHGYLGVQLDPESGSLFALYASQPALDGSEWVQVQRIDPSGTGQLEVRYQTNVSRADLFYFALVGAAEDAVLLARSEYNDQGSLVESQLIVAPAGSAAPRIVASFSGDDPQSGLARDAQYVYWVNHSGRLFALPRAALR